MDLNFFLFISQSVPREASNYCWILLKFFCFKISNEGLTSNKDTFWLDIIFYSQFLSALTLTRKDYYMVNINALGWGAMYHNSITPVNRNLMERDTISMCVPGPWLWSFRKYALFKTSVFDCTCWNSWNWFVSPFHWAWTASIFACRRNCRFCSQCW